jgi:hypothetical protein
MEVVLPPSMRSYTGRWLCQGNCAATENANLHWTASAFYMPRNQEKVFVLLVPHPRVPIKSIASSGKGFRNWRLTCVAFEYGELSFLARLLERLRF